MLDVSNRRSCGSQDKSGCLDAEQKHCDVMREVMALPSLREVVAAGAQMILLVVQSN